MFKTLAFLFLAVSGTAFANLEKICESSNGAGLVWEDNLVAYRSEGETHISTFNGTIITSTPATLRGLIQDGISIWALTAKNLVELNAAGDVLNSYTVDESQGQNGGALSMVKAGNILVIARGYEGMIGFDLEKRSIVWTNSMSTDDDGFASGVTFDGKNVYAAVATRFENGFTGILTVDPMNGQIIKKNAYDVYRWGVISTDAKARMNGDSIILNNGGWIHVITKKQLESDKKIRPRWVAHVIPKEGEINAHYMTMSGEFVLHDNQVMGCGAYTTIENGTFVRKNKLFHVKL
jgi:hypothetical protein